MHITRFFDLILFTCILVMAVGCTHNIQVAYNPTVVEPPIHTYPVSLYLRKEFYEYQHTTPAIPLVHDSFEVAFGSHLRTYAIHVAKSEFGDVEIINGGSPRISSKLLLEPMVLGSNLNPPIDIFSRATGSLSVKWVFRDPMSRQTLFTIPVHCEFMNPSGIFQNLSDVPSSLMTKLTDTTLSRFKESKDLQQLINP